MKNEPARRRLARIRCLLDSIKRIEQARCLPLALCFVLSEVEYVTSGDQDSQSIPIRRKPQKDAECLGEIPPDPNLQVFASGEEFFNNDGAWIKLCQVKSYLDFGSVYMMGNPSERMNLSYTFSEFSEP